MFLLIREGYTVRKTAELTALDMKDLDAGHLQIIDITGCTAPKKHGVGDWFYIKTEVRP